MSGVVNKIKEAVSGGHSHPNDPHTTSTNHGPHNTNVANKADPRVDSDLDGRAGTGKYTSATNAGPHDSNVGNKLDPRVDSDRDGSHTGTTGYGSTIPYGTDGTHGTHGTNATHGTTGLGSSTTTHGPHNSNLLNKADPRVDSDRDGSRNFGASTGATGASAYSSNTGVGHSTGTHGTHAAHGTTGLGSSTTTHGPHNSNLLNKADPRVDSDRDGSRNMGASTGATGASAYGNTGYTGTGASHGTGVGHTTGSTTHGPHDSNLANKADPRVDSDRDGSRNFGAASGATGASAYDTTGTGTHTHGTHGAHGTHGHSGLTGTGPAPNTAGPHKSDFLNKVDPRVDSDLDGSKTVGGNKTYQ